MMRPNASVALVLLLAACGGRSGVNDNDTGPESLPCVHPTVSKSCHDQMCTIPAGCFRMGSPSSEPCRQLTETAHKVTLSHHFEIGQTEVTQAQFVALMGFNPSYFKHPQKPVELVSWNDAAAYCNALSSKWSKPQCYSCKGKNDCVVAEVYSNGAKGIYGCSGYRLPTEAEWEYAGRAGTTTAYFSGAGSTCTNVEPVLDKIGWYARNAGKMTREVAGKQPNGWGLYDISGNVWEWVNDRWTQELGSSHAVDPVGPSGGLMRVVRGGSWGTGAGDTRTASRDAARPERSYESDGFRVARTIPSR